MDRGTLYQLRNLINRRNVTATCKNNVNACEEFFELVVTGHVVSAAMKILGMTSIKDVPSPCIVSPDIWMSDDSERKLKLLEIASKVVNSFVDLECTYTEQSQSDKVYAYACEVLSLGLLYLEFHQAVKEGDGDRVMRVWKYLMLIFKASRRSNYSCEAFILLAQHFITLSPRLAAQLKWSRFVNTSGFPGHNISCDLHMEHLNRVVKTSIDGLGANKSQKAIVRVGKSVSSLVKIVEKFDSETNVTKVSGYHTKRSALSDLRKVVSELTRSKVFDTIDNRKHASFPNIATNVIHSMDEKDLKEWMCDRFSFMSV